MTKMPKSVREPRSRNRSQQQGEKANRWRVHREEAARKEVANCPRAVANRWASARRCSMYTVIWPLRDIAITNGVWCMAYKRRVGRALHIAQWRFNSIALVRAMQVGGGNKRMIDACTLEVKQYLVKAKLRWAFRSVHSFVSSKALARTWYRTLTWHSLRLSPPRTHFEPWKAVGTRGRSSLTAR